MYYITSKGLLVKANFFTQHNYSRYKDPDYLNIQGFWESVYQQRRNGAGVILNTVLGFAPGQAFIGSDIYKADLQSSEFSNTPDRLAVNSVAGFKLKFEPIVFEANITHQGIVDQFRSGDSILTANYSKFSPYVAFALQPFERRYFRFRGFYKHVFRMPSFNDLYYNFIGNTNLKPEEADLFNVGISHEIMLDDDGGGPHRGNILEMSIDGFFNNVKNKIVAIPTKDVFNWSMQNIGRSQIFGFDVSVLYSQRKRHWAWSLNTTFTYNYSVDVTDPTSSSYKNQLPYTPLISGNASQTVSYKGYRLTNNVIYTGARYSLNENIPINYLDPFVDWNIGLSKELVFNKYYRLYLSAKVMNVLGNNYEVVRSFPMPGRYYQFTLKFQYK